MSAEGTTKRREPHELLVIPPCLVSEFCGAPLLSLLTPFSFNPAALRCPAHSQFTDCLPPCHPSCSDLDGRCEGISPKAHSNCKEGCVCQAGYVLHNVKCVLKIECGCQDTQGGFIPVSGVDSGLESAW